MTDEQWLEIMPSTGLGAIDFKAHEHSLRGLRHAPRTAHRTRFMTFETDFRGGDSGRGGAAGPLLA